MMTPLPAFFIGSGDALYTTIANAIIAYLPVLLMRNSRELTIITANQAIECTITPADGVANSRLCDWDAEDIKVQVLASNEGGKQIQADANIHLHISTTDTVIIYGQTATVDSVAVGGNDKFTISTWPWGVGNNPANGSNIMSGGGMIQDCIDAIDAYVESLGPGKGDYAAPIEGWEDSIRPILIQGECIEAGDDDIVDVVVALPAAVFTPVDTSGATVNRARTATTAITVWEDK